MNKCFFCGVFFVISIFIVASCQRKKSKMITDQFIGRVFAFPDSVEVIRGNDVHLEPLKEIIDNDQDILVSIIQGDCHICLQKVNQIAEFLYSEKISGIQSLIIIRTDNPEYFIKVFLPRIIVAPSIFIIDSKEKFYSLNKLTEATLIYHTFVLDCNSEIKAAGDPFFFKNTFNFIVKNYGDRQCED